MILMKGAKMSTKNDRIRLVVVGIIAVIVASGSYAKADFVWTQKAEMPVARYKHSTCVVDGKIYSIGGADPQWNALTRVDEYDPATDTWTRKADIPTAPGFASTSVVNEKIYVICGAAPAGFSSATAALRLSMIRVFGAPPKCQKAFSRQRMKLSVV
jgi:hypothetical protein